MPKGQKFKKKLVTKAVDIWQKTWNSSEKGRFCHSIIPKVSLINWFHGLKLAWSGIIIINRIIANHTSSKSSQNRFNIVDDPICECTKNYETVDHKLFECDSCSQDSRINLLVALEKTKAPKPYCIREILAIFIPEKNVNIIREICEFIVVNNISI